MSAHRPNRRVIATIIVSLCCLGHSAVIGAPQDDATYHLLVQRVNSGDMTIDFRALRLACLKASDCAPRGTRKDLSAMYLASESGVLGRVVEIAERMVQEGFVNIEAHATLAGVYSTLHETEKAKFHLDVTAALMRSIFISGDGKTKDTAFEIICDREEYVMMNALGLSANGVAGVGGVLEDGPHKYDTRRVKDPKTTRELTIFFNIDAFSPTKSRANSE